MARNVEPGMTAKHSVNPANKWTKRVENAIRASNEAGDGEEDDREFVYRSLQSFSSHDDGFLKVRRSADSDDLHLTWTWNLGTHSSRYVYVKVAYWQLAYGLVLLYTKLTQVELGERKATPDKLGHRSA